VSRGSVATWIALIATLAVTTAGVAFVGSTGEDGCRDGPHPGIPASEHFPEDRAWPPGWACRYELLGSGRVIWRDPQYTGLHWAVGVASTLLALSLILLRPPRALQGLVVAWLVLALYGALSSFDVVAAWGLTPLVALPCIALYQRDLRERLRPAPALRWWWACVIAACAWAVTVVSSGIDGDVGHPVPALAVGALLGALRTPRGLIG
jgi:hypothetical protein